jgi:hypothetical protein
VKEPGASDEDVNEPLHALFRLEDAIRRLTGRRRQAAIVLAVDRLRRLAPARGRGATAQSEDRRQMELGDPTAPRRR